jgi:hypothetical protein
VFARGFYVGTAVKLLPQHSGLNEFLKISNLITGRHCHAQVAGCFILFDRFGRIIGHGGTGVSV